MSDHTTRKSSEVKTCSRCKQEKPSEQFRPYSRNADGLNSYCKACQRDYARAHYAANRERYVEKHRAWAKANRERRAYKARAWYAANRERAIEIVIRSRAKHPDRYAARNAVYNAIRRDDLPPASALVCEHCQEAQAQEYHHYNGYSPEHQLDIMAVCIACHTILHQEES